MQLTANLYAYVWQGNDNNCNSYIYANTLGSKHILIDPGHIITPYLREAGYDRLVKSIEKDGLKTEDIGMVFITHAHPDHLEAARKFKEKSGARIAIHHNDAPALKMLKGGEADFLLDEGALQADNLVTERLEVIYTPGHSSGEVSLYWPAKKALAAGDVVFFRNTGRVDLPGGDPGELKASIEKMSKLDVEYLLCGHPYGHPGVITGKKDVQANFAFLLENLWF
jgi:hydroxyacylglutathione hydrolase